MRLVIATCQVDYSGRLTAHLPMSTRLLIVKADGSVLVHADGGSYKPLNWMSAPCTLTERKLEDGRLEWVAQSPKGDALRILIADLLSDTSYDLGPDPGLRKDGVEKHLQELLAERPTALWSGLTLVQREYPTAIGPVDMLCRDASCPEVYFTGHGDSSEVVGAASDPVGTAAHVAVEIKRKATIDAVEQLSRYLELLNRDPLLRPVRGILAAQTIVPQARTLAEDRGIACAVVDYDALRGLDTGEDRLF